MSEKRYYWLKLKEDFFDSIRIKRLRALAGGDTYTIIYLKMLLKAIKNDGILEYIGLEKSISEEIAIELNEKPDNVEVTLKYLLSCGLAEDLNGNCFLPESMTMTGSETDAAERKRRSRENAKKIAERDNVTMLSQDGHTEIDIDIRDNIKDTDIDINTDTKEGTNEGTNCPTDTVSILYGYPMDTVPGMYFVDTELDEMFREFLSMRTQMKAVNSELAIKRLVNKINTLSNGNKDVAMEIIGQSIENSWKGVFPLKTQKIETRVSDVDDWVAKIEQEGIWN